MDPQIRMLLESVYESLEDGKALPRLCVAKLNLTAAHSWHPDPNLGRFQHGGVRRQLQYRLFRIDAA